MSSVLAKFINHNMQPLMEAYGCIKYNIYMAYGVFNILNIKSTVLFFIAEWNYNLISSICNYNCRVCNTAKIKKCWLCIEKQCCRTQGCGKESSEGYFSHQQLFQSLSSDRWTCKRHVKTEMWFFNTLQWVGYYSSTITL